MDRKSVALGPTPLIRLLRFCQLQNKRPDDNNIEYWKAFVKEYFTTTAVLRLGVAFAQDQARSLKLAGASVTEEMARSVLVAPAAVLPRLFQIKFEHGLKEEYLFLGNVQEILLPSGDILVICYRAVEQSVFDNMKVMRHGQLRATFNNELKMTAYDFTLKSIDCTYSQTDVIQQSISLRQVLGQYSAKVDNLRKNDKAAVKVAVTGALQALAQHINDLHAHIELATHNGYQRRLVRSMQIADIMTCLTTLMEEAGSTSGRSPLEALHDIMEASGSFPQYMQNLPGQQGFAADNQPGQSSSRLPQERWQRQSQPWRTQLNGVEEAWERLQECCPMDGCDMPLQLEAQYHQLSHAGFQRQANHARREHLRWPHKMSWGR